MKTILKQIISIVILLTISLTPVFIVEHLINARQQKKIKRTFKHAATCLKIERPTPQDYKMCKRPLLILLLISVLLAPVLAAEVVPGSSVELANPGRNVSLLPIEYDPYPAQPNQIIHIWIKVENFGQDPFENAIFKLIPEYPFSLAQFRISHCWQCIKSSSDRHPPHLISSVERFSQLGSKPLPGTLPLYRFTNPCLSFSLLSRWAI